MTPGDGRDRLTSCGPISPGPSPIRRLTRFEYNNTLRDLLGDTTEPANSFPAEEIGNGFGNDADAMSVSDTLARDYADAASGIASRLISDDARFNKQLNCNIAQTGEAACAQSFIDQYASRAFRRPLSSDEQTQLLAIYTQVRSLPGETFKTAIAAVIEATLQMPAFLYRVESDMTPSSGDKVSRVDGYLMASRLSYMLWGSMPDETLLTVAKTGGLSTPQQVRAQAERMLQDPKAHDVVTFFHETLFKLRGVEGLIKDTTTFPMFGPTIPGLLKQETTAFLDHVVWEGEGTLGAMFTAPYSYMNAELAQFYGVNPSAGAPQGTDFVRVDLNPSRAAGFLTQAALTASLSPGSTQTNPVLRGKFILAQLLCTTPPSPPANFVPKAPDPDPTLTTRERFEAHSKDPACSGCHQLLDPLGFAFEHYDPIGRWRDTDNNKPINTSTELTAFGTAIAGHNDDAVSLADKLAQSSEVRACIVRHWLTFAYGRAQVQEDACTEATLIDAFEKSQGRVRDLLVELTQTDAFLYRQTDAP